MPKNLRYYDAPPMDAQIRGSRIPVGDFHEQFKPYPGVDPGRTPRNPRPGGGPRVPIDQLVKGMNLDPGHPGYRAAPRPGMPPMIDPNSGLRVASRAGLKRLIPGLGVALGTAEMGVGVGEGDAKKAGLGALDAAASAGLFTPAAPIAATYLAGRTGLALGEELNDRLPQGTRDSLGGYVDAIRSRLTGGPAALNETDQRILENLGPTGLPLGPKPASPGAKGGLAKMPYDPMSADYTYGPTGRDPGYDARDPHSVMSGRRVPLGEEGSVGILRENVVDKKTLDRMPTRGRGDVPHDPDKPFGERVTARGLAAGPRGTARGEVPDVNTALGYKDGKPIKYTVNSDNFARESNYVDESGQPAKSFADTRQYKEGVLRAQADERQLTDLSRAHGLAGDRSRAFGLALGNPGAELAAGEGLSEGSLQRRAQAGSKSARAALKDLGEQRSAVLRTLTESRDRQSKLAFDERKLSAEDRRGWADLDIRAEDLSVKQQTLLNSIYDRDRTFRAGRDDKGHERFMEGTKQFDADGKLDNNLTKKYRAFVALGAIEDEKGKLIPTWEKANSAERDIRLARAENAFKELELANRSNAGNWFNRTADAQGPLRLSPKDAVGPSSFMGDVMGGNLRIGPYIWQRLPFTDPNVVRLQNQAGQTMIVSKAEYERLLGEQGRLRLEGK